MSPSTTAQGQTIPSVVKLKKDGDKIVGTLSSEMGEAPVTAEVKGKTLSIYFNFQGQNGPMSIEMTGTVDGDSAKGTMGVGGQTGGDWTATRAKGWRSAKAREGHVRGREDRSDRHLQRHHRAAQHDGDPDHAS